MLRIDDIEFCIKKLSKTKNSKGTISGEIEYIDNRGRENRYSYIYEGKKVWTFGITRGSKKKEKSFGYVPQQIGLNNKEFRKLQDCTITKRDYNELLKERGNL